MAKVLVTGGAGYIGSHTCLALLNAGHEIVVVDNFSNSHPESLVRVKALANKDFCVERCDILDTDLLEKIITQNEIDSVIHFAGLKAVGESVANPLAYYENNFAGSLSLASLLSRLGIKKMVFSSSATVYGDPQYLPLDENHALSTVNPYGRTKLMVEDMFRDVCAADAQWSVALLRYFNPCGAHPSGEIGEDPTGVPNNLMPYVAQVAVGRRPVLHVYGDDYDTVDGTGVRDYIHVVDLADAHVRAIEYICDNKGGCVPINLGTGRGTSVLEIISAFRSASEKPIPYEIAPRRPGDVASCYTDPNNARDILGWETKFTLEDMCQDHWRWQQKSPLGYNNSAE